MEAKFSNRVKEVISLSREEALRLGHNYIGTEHLLLGMIREGEGVAVSILKKLGVPLDALRSEIPATSITALSRRTRACLGRCQGFYCISNVRKIMQNEGLATSSGLIESK